MDTMTINISLPIPLYTDAKKVVASHRYVSVSELIRDAIRRILYPHLTVNGFTKEFEDQILKSEKSPMENDVEWDGATPFTEFILSHQPRANGKNKVRSGILPKLSRANRKTT